MTYRYVVVGGGMTGDSACRGIRDHDADGSIAMFTAEQHDPYARPPLTKALWAGKEESSVWRGTPDLDVDIRHGRRSAGGRDGLHRRRAGGSPGPDRKSVV